MRAQATTLRWTLTQAYRHLHSALSQWHPKRYSCYNPNKMVFGRIFLWQWYWILVHLIFFLQRNHLLNTVCGVISSNSRKICSRTIKCPFHTESQRRDIRLKWMTHAENDETVDIDRSAKFRKEGLALNFNSLFTSVYRQISNQPFFFSKSVVLPRVTRQLFERVWPSFPTPVRRPSPR